MGNFEALKPVKLEWIMRTKILFLIMLLSFMWGFGQVSVYYSEKEDVYGYSISATNKNFSRDQKAENECRSKGGQNAWQIISRDGYGCYAIVKGSNKDGKHFIGAAAGNYSVENAIQNAKWIASSRGADENTLYVAHQGCVEKPETTETNSTNSNSNQPTTAGWSNWKKINSAQCDLGIEYSIKKEVRYQLNYQLWFYYKVRNTSNKNIKFEFSLTSKGKNEFTHPHVLSPGGEDEFMHKMSKDYIDGVAAVKVINTETNQSVCDKNEAENTPNTGLPQSIDEKNRLCREFETLINNQGIKNQVFDNLCAKSYQYSEKDLPKLKNEISLIEREMSNLSVSFKSNQAAEDKKNKDAEIAEQEKQRKEEEKQRLAQEKQEKYNSEISQGDAAMQSEDYAGAMSHYQNAQNYTATEAERSAAQQKYNQAFEAKKAAERKTRIAEQKKRDDTENVTYAATSAATITAMSLLEDAPSEGFTSGKIYMGLGIEQMPLISNNTSPYHTNKSYIEAPLVPGFDMGIILGIANNKKVSLYLNPRFSYGISAFSAGTSGGLFEYGGTAMVRGNWNREFPLKLFAEGGYFKRSATFHYDADASAADSGVSTSTDDVRDGEYNYSVIRYGGGLMYHQIDDDEEYMVKGGVFFDKPSFFPKDIKPNIGFSLQGMYNKMGSLEVYYSPNYFIGGNVLYPSTLEKENKAYFGIKFTRTGKLW